MKREYLMADTVINNGKVLTVNAKDDIVEAIAIKGNKILAVGSNSDIDSYIDAGTTVIDAKGKTVMPGMIDTHCHFILYGLLGRGIIDLNGTVESIEEIKTLIREDAAKRKPGEWIKLSGYDHNKLKEHRHPTRVELDEAAPNNPVQCTRCCDHMAVYNTKALELCGITDASQFSPGEVVINDDGTLHGLLKENAKQVATSKVEYTDEELIEACKYTDSLFSKFGVTSAHDGASYGAKAFSVLQSACENGTLNTRTYQMIWDVFGRESSTEYVKNFIATGIHTGCGNERFKVGPIKIMMDGSSSGPSSAVIDGYTHDPENHGILIWNQEDANKIILEAHKAGWQVTAHCIGDMAVTVMVNAIENALALVPRENHRHRIEHAGITNPELIKRIAKLGIIPVSNPAFIGINGSDYNKFYGERTNYMFAMKSYLENGIKTTIGSDVPVTFPNPMNSFYVALNRKDYNTKEDCGAIQKVGVLDMVRMFTYNGAYASFDENIKGSLEPGKLADVVVLSEDLLSYPKEKVMDITVKYTFVDGKLVYKA